MSAFWHTQDKQELPLELAVITPLASIILFT